jgi:hypothetical protein
LGEQGGFAAAVGEAFGAGGEGDGGGNGGGEQGAEAQGDEHFDEAEARAGGMRRVRFHGVREHSGTGGGAWQS